MLASRLGAGLGAETQGRAPREMSEVQNRDEKSDRSKPVAGARAAPAESRATVRAMDGDDVGSRRASCPRCGRPAAVCLCHALPDSPLPNSVRHLVVLTHPAEVKRALTSTSQLLPQLLERSTTIVGRLFRPGDHPVLDEALARRDTLLLFPRAGAHLLQPQGLSDAASVGVTADTSGGSGRERLDAFVAHAWARQRFVRPRSGYQQGSARDRAEQTRATELRLAL